MNWRGQESRREEEECEKKIGVGRRVDDRKRKGKRKRKRKRRIFHGRECGVEEEEECA